MTAKTVGESLVHATKLRQEYEASYLAYRDNKDSAHADDLAKRVAAYVQAVDGAMAKIIRDRVGVHLQVIQGGAA